jgi:hypothetical protein
MELFLEEGIPVKLKKRMAKHMGQEPHYVPPQPQKSIPMAKIAGPAQAPSTQRLLDQMAAETGSAPPSEAVTPTDAVAVTPAAVAALNARRAVISASVANGAFTGKPNDGRTSPKKW